MGPVQVPAAVHPTAQVPSGSQVPRPASAQTEGHAAAASLVGASPASASDGWPSPASPASTSGESPSPASIATLASSPGPLESPMVASASLVLPASRSTERVPSSGRAQPRATHGKTSSTARAPVGRDKVAWRRPTRRGEASSALERGARLPPRFAAALHCATCVIATQRGVVASPEGWPGGFGGWHP